MANFFDDPKPQEEPRPGPQVPRGNYFDDPGPPAETEAERFNRPFGELKPYTPSPSERVANYASDLFRGLGADPYTAGKFGRGARDIAQLTPASIPLNVADAAHYTAQGDPTNAALSAIGVVPGAAIGKQAIANTARTLAPNFADSRLGEVFRAGPSSEQLMGRGGAQIQQFGNAPTVYSPGEARKFVNDTRKELASQGKYDMEGNRGVYKALDVLEEKANNKGLITRQDVDEFRAALSFLKKGPQAPTAMAAQSELYDAMKRTGDPLLQRGIENYGAGKRTEMVETILRNSERAKNPDVALGNQLRGKVQTLEQRPRGFTTEEVADLDKAREAGRLRERFGGALQNWGAGATLLGGTGGALLTMIGKMDPGTAVKTAIVPAAAAGAGSLLKASGGAARRAATEDVATKIAQRSPLFQETAAANAASGLTYPGSPAQDFVMRNAITQELIRRQRGETD